MDEDEQDADEMDDVSDDEQAAERPPLLQRVLGWLRDTVRWVVWVVVILILAVVAELIPILKAPDVYFAQHRGTRDLAMGLVIAMAVLGTLLLVFSQFIVRWPRPEELTEAALGEGVAARFAPMSHGEVEASIAQARAQRGLPLWSRWFYRHAGPTLGGSFAVEAPLAAMKQAGRTGAWRHQPVWQLAYLMGLGALLMLVGLFGIGIVLGPPVIRLICAGALAYALVHTAWAFAKA